MLSVRAGKTILRFCHPPYTDVSDIGTLTAAIQKIADWITFDQAHWPRKGIFADGFATRTIDQAIQEHFLVGQENTWSGSQ